MGSQYLIDTNVVIDYLGKKIPPSGITFINEVIDNTPNLSVITKVEVLGFKSPQDSHKLLSEFIDDSIIYPILDDIVEVCIELRQQQRIKLPDAIIAATALIFKYDLITRNTADFKNIAGLKIIDPWAY